MGTLEEMKLASPRTLRILGSLSAVMVAIALVLVFLVAPQERTMGEVQRIFYFHVGAAWIGALAFLVALVTGALYLRSGKAQYDLISLSSIEIGLVFITMVLITGSIWARPAWNTWWVWTPRLTTATIMWLVYLAYFMLRGAVEDPNRRRRYAAVYSIVGFASVILTFISTSILADTHPALFFGSNSPQTKGDAPLAPGMRPAFFFSLLTFTVLYITFLLYRVRLEALREHVEALKARFLTP